MSKRGKIQIRRLQELEDEFQSLLVSSLQQCGQGHWGLFGAYDRIKEGNPAMDRILSWPDADRLRQMAIEIQSIRAQAGEHNENCDEFLRLCAMARENDLGEPIIAREFLRRIENQR